MSSRQLRKLQKQRVPELNTQEAESSDEGDESYVAPKPRSSLFAALGGDDGDDDEDEDHDDDNQATAQRQPDVTPQDASDPQPETKKSSKKKKKKKKAKAAVQSASAAEPADFGDDGEEDEIDKAMKELNIKAQNQRQGGGGSGEFEPSSRLNALLKINTHHLKAVNEMRNLFGRDVIASANTEEQQEQGRQQRRRPGQQNQQVDLETFLRAPAWEKKLPEVTLRRNVFIQGREHWPRQSAGGLTMKEIGRMEDGATEYAYCFDKEYDRVQALFFACVQIGDPMRMVHMLKQFPYHVSTLLQVSSVAKQNQDMALSAELCERALFTFGRVATTAFRQNLEQGRARLNFCRPENRQFWLAGYHYLKSLIRKGTYRTALEWAKLLYALDPKDPYAMRHFIHVLALRAYESEWLLAFLDQLSATGTHEDAKYLNQTAVLAKLQSGDDEGARRALINGIQMVPWLYCALFQELGIDAPPSIWGIKAATDSRSFWVKLYISQAKDLWNNSQAMPLLESVAKSMDRVDTGSLPPDDAQPDLGCTRLAYLDGQTSLMALAPREILDSQPNYEFDPLPPAENDNIFTSEGVHLPWVHQRNSAQSPNQDQLNQLLARMQGMLPGGRPAAAGAGAAQAGPGAFGAFPEDDEDGEDGDMPDWDDDEELRRDLEAHAARGNGPGLIGTLMQMFGAGTARSNTERDEARGEGEAPPGSWPEDESDEDEDEDHGRTQQ